MKGEKMTIEIENNCFIEKGTPQVIEAQGLVWLA